jgi:hypothetical protein
MGQFLAGALAMGFGVAGLFFLRFWRKTRDRLFALFALAFFVMAANRIELTLTVAHGHWVDHPYWVRLIAFTLILAAILDKNRSRTPPAERLR